MTVTWTVTRVEGPDERGMRVVWYHDDEGAVGGHRFPVDTSLWRAAEYDIDPAAGPELLDIVLHEPFITSADWTGPAHAPGADHLHPHFLYNCSDAAAARAHHLGRIASAKSRHVVADPQNLLAGLHDAHVVDARQPEREQLVAATRAAFDRGRPGAS
jgi:hypothetical protein